MGLVAVPLVIYLAVVGLACGLQRSMLFPVPRPARTPVLEGAVLEHVTAPGANTVALYIAAPPGAPTIVWFHGNGEQLADDVSVFAALASHGFGVYAVEYPGYGLAGGEPSERSIFAAARAALDRLAGPLGVPREQTVLLGQSLGTGVAVAMAAEGRGHRLVLISPYTSIGDAAQAAMPWLPARWLVVDRFDSASRAASVHIPALVVHGDRDEVIPFEQGRRMAERLHARFEPRAGRGHNDLWSPRDGETGVMDLIAAFAREAP